MRPQTAAELWPLVQGLPTEERLRLTELALRSTCPDGDDVATDVFRDTSDGQRARNLAVAFNGMSIVAAAADRARRANEARLMRLAEAGIVGIIVSDSSGRILEANDTYLATVGYSREDFEAGRLGRVPDNALMPHVPDPDPVRVEHTGI